MLRVTSVWSGSVAWLVFLGMTAPTGAQYGESVVSYDAGTTASPAYMSAASALGEPARSTGGGVVSTFNPPFQTDQIVSVGEGGHITLRLSRYAIAKPGPEIGVFENVGLIDEDYPNGQAGSPAAVFGRDSAVVEVSADGVLWSSLGSVVFELPSNGYTDVTSPYAAGIGASESDFHKPFVGSTGCTGLSCYDGLPYSDAGGPDIRELLDGSGGGTWLDISSTGLPRVGYIRFSVADDLNPSIGRTLELDAVSIANGSFGGVVPEPGAMASVLTALFGFYSGLGGRRSRKRQELPPRKPHHEH